jgi:hypothetical protein
LRCFEAEVVMSTNTRNVFALLVAAGAVAAAGPARADDGTPSGLSLGAWAGAAMDRAVARADDGTPLHDTQQLAGVTALANVQGMTLGGALDGTPGILGNGQLWMGALAGWGNTLGTVRLVLLCEAGEHRFSDVGGTMLGRQMGDGVWVPYAGARLGVAWTIPDDGHLELGLWTLARYDARNETVTYMSDGERTDYRVGGYMLGLALQVGARFEARPPTIEVAAR